MSERRCNCITDHTGNLLDIGCELHPGDEQYLRQRRESPSPRWVNVGVVVVSVAVVAVAWLVRP